MKKINKNEKGLKNFYKTSFVWFYGISTIVGYLILNPVYTYILDIYDL